MKIFVTGATGFIGSHLVRKLTKSGYAVTAYVREKSNLSYLSKKGVKIIYGDILDLDTLRMALKGAEAVFHNAALASDWTDKENFYQTNVTGTRNVLSSLENNSVKKLILTSSAGVLGEEDSLQPKDENSPYKPKINFIFSGWMESGANHYRMSKMLAEKETIEFCKDKGVSLVVIRPVWVYGPREFNAGPFIFCKAVLKGIPLIPAGKYNRFHVVYVEDLIDAMLLALKEELEGVNVFIIGNQEASLARNYLGLFCRALGKNMPYCLPEIFFLPLALSLELIYKMLRIKKSPFLTRSRVKMFCCNNIYGVGKAKKELNFTAPTSLELGIRKTVRWWRQNGFL